MNLNYAIFRSEPIMTTHDLAGIGSHNQREKKAIFEEGSCIASDLILKVIGINGRKIKLPVKVSYVKEYCISNLIEEKDLKVIEKIPFNSNDLVVITAAKKLCAYVNAVTEKSSKK